jgi:hypothetical protein
MRLLIFTLFGLFVLSAAAAGNPAETDSQMTTATFDAGADTSEPADEPQVTITPPKDAVIEEYRVGNKLYMIKIIPRVGPPYYLIDDQGDGKFVRQESLDSGFRPPRWVLHRF